jgi:hypothetical protein
VLLFGLIWSLGNKKVFSKKEQGDIVYDKMMNAMAGNEDPGVTGVARRLRLHGPSPKEIADKIEAKKKKLKEGQEKKLRLGGSPSCG